MHISAGDFSDRRGCRSRRPNPFRSAENAPSYIGNIFPRRNYACRPYAGVPRRSRQQDKRRGRRCIRRTRSPCAEAKAKAADRSAPCTGALCSRIRGGGTVRSYPRSRAPQGQRTFYARSCPHNGVPRPDSGSPPRETRRAPPVRVLRKGKRRSRPKARSPAFAVR